MVTSILNKSSSIFFIVLILSGCASTGSNFDMTATPLQLAVGQADKTSGYKPRTPDMKKVKELVEGGADVNYVNGWGSSLHAASRSGTAGIVSYLIAHGANINLGDNAGITPLMWAANADKFDIVKLLVEKGADVNAVASLDGRSALSQAAFSGRYAMVTYLIDKGANVSRQSSVAYLQAAFGMGLKLNGDDKKIGAQSKANNEKMTYEYVATLDLMKSNGASVNSVGKYGETALYWTASVGNPKITRYFLKEGVDPNLATQYVGTPLVAAQKQKDARIQIAQRTTPFPGMNEKEWSDYKKALASGMKGLDEVIAILTPVTNGGMQTAALSSPSGGGNEESSVGGQVADCIKLRVSLKACEHLPFPFSTGCNTLAKSQFHNSSLCGI